MSIAINEAEYRALCEMDVRFGIIQDFIRKDKYYLSGKLDDMGLSSETAKVVCTLLGIQIPEKERGEDK